MNVFLRIVFLFILISIVLVTVRFSVLQLTIKFQKKTFRHSTLIHNKKKQKVFIISMQSLFVDNNEIEWKENNKEIVVNGKYHEVIEIKKDKNFYQVFAIEDNEENKLFYQFFISENLNKKLVNCFLLIYSFNAIENCLNFSIKNCFKELNNSIYYLLKFGTEFENLLFKPPVFKS